MKKKIYKIEIFNNLSAESITKIIQNSKIKKIYKGELLFLDKTEMRNLYFIIEGIASLYKLNNLNDKKIIFILGNNNFLNESIFENSMSTLNCEFLSNATVLEIPKELLINLMKQDFNLSKIIINSLSLKYRKTCYQLKNSVGNITADELLASKLWKLAKDFGVKTPEGVEINFNLTITYLADFLGIKRETTSRQIKKLSNIGLLKFEKNRFTIFDTEKLSSFAKRCDVYHNKKE